jgi:hypothetical protein
VLDMRKRHDKDEDDGSARFEWGGGVKGEKPKEETKSNEGGKRDEGERDEGDAKKQKKAPKMKLEPSGLLRQEALQDESGVIRKYVASEDSAMPTQKYSLYPFKVRSAFFCFFSFF